MDRFEPFSLDELHTLATALGNAVKHIHKEFSIHETVHPATAHYLAICSADNEAILAEVNKSLEKKRSHPNVLPSQSRLA